MDKHILFIGNTAWGMYNFRRFIFSSLISKGFSVTVISPADPFYQEKLSLLGCKCISMEMEAKGINPFKDILLVMNLKKTMRDINPDFCFFYTIKANIYGSIAASQLKIPHIAITTGLGYTFIKKNLISYIAKQLYKYAFRKTLEVWFLNEDDKKAFIESRLIIAPKASILKGEGVDLSHFSKTELPTKTSFLLIARMLWDKGVGEFVEAAKILKNKYQEIDFNLLGFVGVDNPSAISQSQIEKWCKSGIVNYLGVSSNIKDNIKESTCIVLPSYREGIPLSLLEGAAMNRPLITTNAPGCKETIDDSVTGFLCEVRDVSSLASAMEKIILMDPKDRLKMGLAGREKMANEYDICLVVDKYLKILSKYL